MRRGSEVTTVDMAEVAAVGGLMLTPTLVIGALVKLPAVMGRVRRAWSRRRHRLDPTVPPIERVAADLRRLLLLHDAVRRSTGIARRAHHLRALEAAITDRAVEAAMGLDVPVPPRPSDGCLAPPDLGRLLRALVAAGLLLPPTADLLVEPSR